MATNVTFADKSQSEIYDAAKINASDINDLKAACNLFGQVAVIAALTDNSGGATADGTIAVVTAPTALTNSTGGTPSSTLAAIASGAPADLTAQGVINGVISNALASIAVTETANRTAIVALTDAVKELSTKLNAILAELKTSGLVASS